MVKGLNGKARAVEEAIGRGLVKLPGNWGKLSEAEMTQFTLRCSNALADAGMDSPTGDHLGGQSHLPQQVVDERWKICHKCANCLRDHCRLLEDPYSLGRIINDPPNACPEGKWIAQWKDVCTDSPIPEPKHDKLLLTQANGVMEDLLDLTGPRMREYAESSGADYVELRGLTQDWWMLEKYRARPYLQHYKRWIYVDADVIFLRDAPNLFEVVPEGQVGAHNDWPYLNQSHWYLHRERDYFMSSQGVPNYKLYAMWNAGVMVFSDIHIDMWEPPRLPFRPTHCAEQFWFERQIKDVPHFDLPTEYNCQFWMRDFFSMLNRAKIIHLAAALHDERMELTERILKW